MKYLIKYFIDFTVLVLLYAFVSQRSADHIRNQIRDVRGAVEEGLKQFDDQAHQKAESDRLLR